MRRRAGLSCALSDYFGTVLSGRRVTGSSIYVKRLGHPEIRQTALEIMQSRPRCLSLRQVFNWLVSTINKEILKDIYLKGGTLEEESTRAKTMTAKEHKRQTRHHNEFTFDWLG